MCHAVQAYTTNKTVVLQERVVKKTRRGVECVE